jgi:hypothetical protein
MAYIIKKYDQFLQSNEKNYFSFIAMTILVGSIWGGLTAMLIDKFNAPVWQMAVNVASSMACNVAAIGQAPLRWVVNLFVLSMLLNTILMLIQFA